MTLILASSSPYRLQLLRDAGFEPLTHKPKVDEDEVKSNYEKKSPLFIAEVLAQLKSENVETQFSHLPEYLIIGSDQVCVFNNQILNKPETLENNVKQLERMEGETHSLITAVCLIMKKTGETKSRQVHFYNQTDLKMKPLSYEQILSYVQHDKPFDCAGGYKFESLGYTLMDKVTTDDESAIQGLPMKKCLEFIKAFQSLI